MKISEILDQYSQSINKQRYKKYSSKNNGLRMRWLKLGELTANLINTARKGDLSVVLQHVKNHNIDKRAVTFSRLLIKEAMRLKEDVKPYIIVDSDVSISSFETENYVSSGRLKKIHIWYWPHFGFRKSEFNPKRLP